jgi:hypothetical protein
MDDVEELCSRLIRVDTTNYGGGESAGEREAGELVATVLSAAGIESKVLERTPRRSNVVARVPGADSSLPPLLVQGHLDVVPADPVLWSRDPFSGEITDGYVWGRGATDMKDFIAMVLTVLQIWAQDGRQPRRDIVPSTRRCSRAAAPPSANRAATPTTSRTPPARPCVSTPSARPSAAPTTCGSPRPDAQATVHAATTKTPW